MNSKATVEEFVKVWNEATSAWEVAQRFGYSPAAAWNRASELRRRGYVLKSHVGGALRLPLHPRRTLTETRAALLILRNQLADGRVAAIPTIVSRVDAVLAIIGEIDP